ncbi:MAG: hypothetical protein GY756_15830 [bacterium]|nr:hypothetical protein [bacterium]
MIFKIYNSVNKPTVKEKSEGLNYLFKHLDEYGDPTEDIEKAIELTKGDITLHAEPDNPARFLYKKISFSSKYIEMRYKKQTTLD